MASPAAIQRPCRFVIPTESGPVDGNYRRRASSCNTIKKQSEEKRTENLRGKPCKQYPFCFFFRAARTADSRRSPQFSSAISVLLSFFIYRTLVVLSQNTVYSLDGGHRSEKPFCRLTLTIDNRTG